MNAHALADQPTAETGEAPILNVAAYKFVALDNLSARRQALLQTCQALGLRGTILLSPEGINLFLAGPREAVRAFLAELRSDAAFADLETKDSYSDEQPFRRMLVRLKKEIIAFGVEGICPAQVTSPKLAAQELKAWLDAGRRVRLLDVRNDYEVDLGTFAGAEHLHIGHFREFPRAIAKLPPEAKHEPIVMFCTGGIRCEKAGPLMEQAGFEHVYQLDGGILKYFEECGGEHYQGACFVFDGRVALDPQLQPTGNLLCFACQAVLTPEEIVSERFLFGQWCPHCYREPTDRMRDRLQERQTQIETLARSQPGSTAYENIRQVYVPRQFAGLSLIDFLDAWHPPTTREQWQRWIDEGQFSYQGQIVSADLRVREGQSFEQRMPGIIEPQINPAVELIYEDDWLVVVNKPAPLPVHPSGRYNRNTLSSLMAAAYPKQKLRVAHRLDANTSGLVLLCRTQRAAREVQPQFAAGSVRKRYLARVHGHPPWETFSCRATIGGQPAHAGARQVDQPDGLAAVTEFRVLQRESNGTAIIEAQPRTGRTHQIRAHLWHLGHPIVGDPLYLPEQRLGTAHTLRIDEPPMHLRAVELELLHPDTRRPIVFALDGGL